MHLAIVTAGGAGMFCGSCMHDNTWARALMRAGHEVSLIPTYTPIRVDEDDASARRVFFGGINVYGRYRWPRAWSRLPRPVTRWLDAPWLLQLAGRLGVSNDAADLGALTLAMLDGEAGPHRREIDELVQFLANDLKPDAILFSNALLVGSLRALKQEYDGPVLCVLQGDDIFLQALPEPYRRRAIDQIAGRAQHFDAFITHSHYYRGFMSGYLRLPSEKFALVPLGIDVAGHNGRPERRGNPRFTIGYFARICPEKGLHQLVEAFRLVHARHPATVLRAGGYLGPRDACYLAGICRAARDLGDAFQYVGSPSTHAEKVAFLSSLDALSVPTVYHEPKGLYILEALANGTPVVQPRHGAFPELVETTGGGVLTGPGDPAALADAREELIQDDARRLRLAHSGHVNVRLHYRPEAMVGATLAALEQARGHRLNAAITSGPTGVHAAAEAAE